MADRSNRKLVYPDAQVYWTLGESAPALNAALETFADIIAHATVDLEPRFSRGEWCYVADMCNGLATMGHPLQGVPGMLALQAHDADKLDGYGAKWDVDAAALSEKLAALTADEAAALLFAVRFFWDCHESIDPARDEWWTLKFRRELRGGKG